MVRKLLVSTLTCLSFGSIANETSISDSLFELPLKDLLNIEVSIASVESESVMETPAIVSRYSRSDLESMGVSNLREMFNFVPGVNVQDSMPGWASVQIRGIDEVFNQKVLFLLDGVPYHQPSHSLIPMEGVPWESISHIEVIRGPGAVFHGSQASSGVINVITRKDTNNDSIALKLGSHQLVEGHTFLSKSLSDESSIYLAAEYRKEDGHVVNYQQNFGEGIFIEDEVNRKLEKKSLLAKYSNQDFSAMFQTFSDHTVGVNDVYTNLKTLQPFIVESNGYLIHVANTWSLDDLKVTSFADYNHYTFDLYINNALGPEVGALASKGKQDDKDYRYRLGASFAKEMTKQLDLVGGLELESRSVGAYSLAPEESPENPLVTLFDRSIVREMSAYGQFEYTASDWSFVLGARLTDNELNGQKVTPRVGLVYKIDERQSIKALYSTGFNSPNPTQTSIVLPGDVMGNSDLSAEVVKASDIAYSYSKENLLFVANLYYLEADGFIVRRYSEPDNAVSFFNEGNYIRSGAEFDLQHKTGDKTLFANLSYLREGHEEDFDDADAFRVPKLTMAVGASININDKQLIGGNLSYIGARRDLDSYTVVNLNYTLEIDNYAFSIVARNIFDDEIITPNNTAQNSLLNGYGEIGRNYQLVFKVGF